MEPQMSGGDILDEDAIITSRLLTFRNIQVSSHDLSLFMFKKELQQRNEELVRAIRVLTQKQEEKVQEKHSQVLEVN